MELSGLTERQLLEMRATDNYYDPAERRTILDRLRRDGFVRDAEVRLKRADGSPYWALLSISPLGDRGKTSYVSWIIDITRRRAAEEAVRRSERRLDAILESSPIGATVVNADGSFEFVNSGMADMLGLSKQEFLALKARDL